MKENQFFWIQNEENLIFVNLDHIVTVDVVQGTLRLRLTDGRTVNVDGPGRIDLLKTITHHAVTLTGEKYPENALKAIGKQLDALSKSES